MTIQIRPTIINESIILDFIAVLCYLLHIDDSSYAYHQSR
jgi:hypothetical protein